MLTADAGGFALGASRRIFSLQRFVTPSSLSPIPPSNTTRAPILHAPLPTSISAETTFRLTAISALLTSLTPDFSILRGARYARQMAPGLQENTEALALLHYLETQALLSHEDAARRCGDTGVVLGAEDFLLGVADLGGEMMRFAITGMATGGEIPRAEGGGDILADFRALKRRFEDLRFENVRWRREAERKMDVMRTCVEKIENAACEFIMRGRERPKG